ncbi:MAG: RDD family protein [Egibacteraceae bacterium]
MVQDGTVVTPEAVPLEFEAAHIGSRFVALLVDALIQWALFFVLFVAGGLLGSAGALDAVPEWLGITLVILLFFGVVWGYPVGMETFWRGRTLGKAAMGLRVVTVEGAPIGFRHAAIRAAVGLVDFQLTFGFAAVLSAVASKRHQRLGDLAAGTLVVRERTGAGEPTAVTFTVPPGAEAYAATLDVSGLRARDYATIRQLLLRVPDLDPPSRAVLATDLATSVARRIHHDPPPDASAELFLRCVAARYQQRGAASAAAVGPSPAAGSPPAGGFVPPA